MKKYVIYYLLFLFAIIFLTSCNYRHKNNNNIIISDTLLTKTISFPNCLLKLDGNQFQKIDSFIFKTEDKTKVISIIDGNCPKCIINQLNNIDSIFNGILHDDDLLIFILNVSKQDSVFFMRNLQPSIKATGVILWDSNYNFERQNNLFTPNANLRTFMVNKKNRIIQYGNPVMKPDVIFEYKEKLKSSIK